MITPADNAEVCAVSSLPRRKREGYHSSPVGRRQRYLSKCRKGEILMTDESCFSGFVDVGVHSKLRVESAAKVPDFAVGCYGHIFFE